MYRKQDFIRFHVRTTPSGEHIWFKTLTGTADFFGWGKHFQEWWDFKKSLSTDGYVREMPYRSDWRTGGKPIRICRSPSKHGHPARVTQTLRISSLLGLRDLAEIAHFAEGDWYWMERPCGARVDRADWEQLYASIP